jgi:hypothetical protein
VITATRAEFYFFLLFFFLDEKESKTQDKTNAAAQSLSTAAFCRPCPTVLRGILLHWFSVISQFVTAKKNHKFVCIKLKIRGRNLRPQKQLKYGKENKCFINAR